MNKLKAKVTNLLEMANL